MTITSFNTNNKKDINLAKELGYEILKGKRVVTNSKYSYTELREKGFEDAYALAHNNHYYTIERNK